MRRTLIALADDPVTDLRGSESDMAGRNRGFRRKLNWTIFGPLNQDIEPPNTQNQREGLKMLLEGQMDQRYKAHACSLDLGNAFEGFLPQVVSR
jgi:hypothetical protein